LLVSCPFHSVPVYNIPVDVNLLKFYKDMSFENCELSG